jgi:cytidyltransferase-like protein
MTDYSTRDIEILFDALENPPQPNSALLEAAQEYLSLTTRTISIASGYFNPVHKGHLELFERAKAISDVLVVIVNNDLQRELKGSKKFQDEEERIKIISSLRTVNHAELSIDEDRSVRLSLEMVYHKYKEIYPNPDLKFLFVNGGDQFSQSVAEKEICERLGIEMVDSMGAKIQSSSSLLSNIPL